MNPAPRAARSLTLTMLLALSVSAAAATEGAPGARSEAAAAVERAQRQLAQRPRDATARFALGVALAEAGRDADAMAIYRGLIEDHPELPEPYNNLAVLQARAGDTDAARASLEAAVRARPDHAIAQENLGDIYVTLAARAWQRASAADPTRSGAAAKLALVRELRSKAAAP